MTESAAKDNKKTREQLLAEVRDLSQKQAEQAELKKELAKTKRSLKEQAASFEERVKELNCLHSISELAETPDVTSEEIFQGAVTLIPPSFRYPHDACARIVIEGRVFQTENFQDTIWKQQADIVYHDVIIGSIEVCYLKEKPESDEGPFSQEECKLINIIANYLGKIAEHVLIEEDLRASEERYRTLSESVPNGIVIFSEGRILFANTSFAHMFGYQEAEEWRQDEIAELVSADYRQRFKEIHEELVSGAAGEVSYECKFAARGEQEFWAAGHSSQIKWEGRQVILSTLRDITQERIRAKAIQEETELLRRENIQLKSTIKDRYRFGDIIGKSRVMHEVYELILRTAEQDTPMIIYGESGTGKELVARAIHDISRRHGHNFEPVNCGAIPETLIESEFFGHKKGAFTGAVQDKQGYLRQARGGTLFLDEIGEISLGMQVKLLRALEEKQYYPLGSSTPEKSDFRLIAATNRDLKALVREGRMREDFFYRIHIVPVEMPPLRERKGDIPLLIDHFLKRYNPGDSEPKLPPHIIEAMSEYGWPGNVRELQNVIHRYLTLGRLDFPGLDVRPLEAGGGTGQDLESDNLELKAALDKIEERYILKALEASRWRRAEAALILGIDRRSLYRKMKKYGID